MSTNYSPARSSALLPSYSTPAAGQAPFSTGGPSNSRRPSSRLLQSNGPTSPVNTLSEAGLPRRQSRFNARQNSTVSVSGASTPGRRKRVFGGKVNEGEEVGERDWAGMEPDDIFRKLPVGEVKKVESKMRDDAMNKQSELRSMVGTRYRDLLTSATQITSLHSSSLRLSSSLKTVAQACADPTDLPSGFTDSAEKDIEDDDAMSLLPVAAHMKLLLDAPEVLYSQLSHHSHLNAAYLWLLTRVVREGLTRMPEEVSSPYLPLLQKQWETLLPFRGQIVHRATAALRVREKMDDKVLSDTLLSIILLDGLPLSDALNLFLTQRTKSLRDLLSHHSERAILSEPHLSPGAAKRERRNSRISTANAAREAVHERDAVGKTLLEAVKCLLETVGLAKAVFEKRKKGAGTNDNSQIEEMIRSVQEGEPLPTSPVAPLIHRNAHNKRTSRLVSISQPVRFNITSSPTISTPKVLQTLPSSQILLQHLPTSITAFTPFITPSSSPNLDQILKTWQTSSIQLLKDAVPSWLASLGSVSDIWHIRGMMRGLLGELSGLEKEIRDGLESGWEGRVREVWTIKLEEILSLAENGVRDAGESIRSKGDVLDTDPDSFLFSDLAFPTAPASTFTLSSHTATFTNFITSLTKRSKYRTPLLDEVLTSLETTSKALRTDMKDIPSTMYADCGVKVSEVLTRLVRVLERVLESMGPERGDGKSGVESEIFVGRVALYLSDRDGFLKDIVGEADVNLDEVVSSLIGVHVASTTRWRERSVQEALTKLTPLFELHRGPTEIQSTWQGPYPTQPSPPIITSLYSLVAATRQLGIPPGTKHTIIEGLVHDFVEAVRKLEGWEVQVDQAVAQAVVDLGFLGMLAGDKSEDDKVLQNLIAKLPKDTSPEFLPSLQTIIQESLRRTQLLLHPLTLHLTPTNDTTPARPKDRNASLLRFGAVGSGRTGSGLGSEFKSPVPVAKPGKRFGLLSVVA